mmetsp:Transcript_32945/g.71844  ORF Transcript_32945/g.71844 Transcript_32945/m.71844 type:complete len:376 (+) Transcript_32945:56-1183(+)
MDSGNPPERCAVVVGCGAIGMATALELLRRGWRVAIVAEHGPLDAETCSQGAGGLWMPFHVEPVEESAVWAAATLRAFLSERAEGGPRSGFIELTPALFLVDRETPKAELPPWTRLPELHFEVLSREQFERKQLRASLPEGMWGTWFFETLVVDAPPYLQSMLDELRIRGVGVCFGTAFPSLEAAAAAGATLLPAGSRIDAIVNCTGLSADSISGHAETMTPGRGVVMRVERSAEVDAVMLCDVAPFSDESPAYCIPRGPGQVTVGGTYIEGDFQTEPTEQELLELREKASFLYPSLGSSRIIDIWVGLRPVRPSGVRIEVEALRGSQEGPLVVHNYGHGGGGWTTMYGCATVAVDKLEASLADRGRALRGLAKL